MAAKRLLEGITSSIIFGHIKQERDEIQTRDSHTHCRSFHLPRTCARSWRDSWGRSQLGAQAGVTEQNEGLLGGEEKGNGYLQGSSRGENLAPNALPQTCELFHVQICKPDHWAQVKAPNAQLYHLLLT